MENTCSVCRGDGLVGVGENPHLKQGDISTCSACVGTGKATTSEVTASVAPTGNPEVPVTNPEVEPKKNEESTPESESSFHE